MKRASYFGRLPFPPKNKVAKLIRKEDQKVMIFSSEVPEISNLVTVAVSLDKIHCGFLEMGPGSNWYFVDEHLGDEIYYIISGNLTELECVSGDCVEANPGDTLFIPKGCKHKGYNFSTEKLRLLWAIAPNMWPEETDTSFAQEDIRMYKQGKDKYALSGQSEKEIGQKKQFKQFVRDVNQLGAFPLSGPESRKQPIYYYVMNESNCITTIFGTKYPMRLRFYVSNDYLHVGEFYLPSGGVGSRVSEVDEHGGDTILYSVQGPLTVFLPEEEKTFYIKNEELLYLPPNTPYQIINYNAEPAIGYFIIGGEL